MPDQQPQLGEGECPDVDICEYPNCGRTAQHYIGTDGTAVCEAHKTWSNASLRFVYDSIDEMLLEKSLEKSKRSRTPKDSPTAGDRAGAGLEHDGESDGPLAGTLSGNDAVDADLSEASESPARPEPAMQSPAPGVREVEELYGGRQSPLGECPCCAKKPGPLTEDCTCNRMRVEHAELRAENKRLREALERLVGEEALAGFDAPSYVREALRGN